MLFIQGAATHKITDNDAALTFFVVFEADNYRAVAGKAATPAVVPVLFVDFACCHEFEVAVRADIVVTAIAF